MPRLVDAVIDEMTGRVDNTRLDRFIEAATQRGDTELAGRLTQERRAAMSGLLTAAIGRGELPRDTPVDDLIDALVGPLFYRRLIRQTRTSRTWIASHLDRTLLAFDARPGPHGRT